MRTELMVIVVFGGAILYYYLKQKTGQNNKRLASGSAIDRLMTNSKFDYKGTKVESDLDRKIAESLKENTKG